MMPLENQHRPQPHRPLPASPDVHSHSLRLLQKLISPRTIPRNKCPLSLPSQILNLVWILLRQSLQSSVQILPNLCGVLDEIQTLDFLDDCSEQDCARGVTHPGVELAVGLVGAEVRVAEIVAGGLGFLGEGDHIRRFCHVPVLMSPELAGGTDTGLDLVDDEEDVVALCDFA